MARKNVCVICDTDEKYAKSLMGVINDDNTIPYCAQVFTDKSELDRYLVNSKPEILMINEDIFTYNSKVEDAKVLVLCENEMDAKNIRSENGKVQGICKYQPTYQLLHSLVDEDYKGNLKGNVNQSKIVGVYGFNSSAKALMSIVISKKLSEMYRTLFIDLDQFCGLREILKSDTNEDLSDALYVFNQNKRHFHKNICTSISHIEKLDFIPASACAEDISDIDAEMFYGFIQGLIRELGYEYVVINIAEGIRAPWEFMEFCDDVFMVNSENYIEELKWLQLQQLILQKDKNHIIDNIKGINIGIEPEYINSDFYQNVSYSDAYSRIDSLLQNKE